ncbi:MAG: hypothetical protein K0R11_1763, partial [Acidimicrobiales bacterium]|nr:hypothetical protein [Acidimicrobiales bacterium]
MGAVWYRARSELRRRWPSTLVLAVLAGVTAGIVLASVAGARRTSTAMDRFVEFNRPSHLFLFDEAGELDEEAVTTLPEVVSTARAAYVLMAPPGPDGERSAAQAGTINPFLIIPLSGVSNRPRVVEGRLPDPDEPLETIVDEELAEERRVGPGDTLRMYGYAEEQLEESPGVEPPRGPAMDFEVTGVFRAPDDVVPRASPDDVVYAGTQDMLLGPAWQDRFGDEVASYGPEGTLELGLRSGLAAVDEVEEQVRRIAGGDAVQIDANSESSMAREASDRSVRFGVISILAFAAVAAVTGVALLGQAMARTFAVEADDAPVLRALGIGSRSLALVAALRAAAVAVPAGLVAVAVAVGLSPLFPISLARKAEIDPGVDVDVPVLVIGAIAAVVLL